MPLGTQLSTTIYQLALTKSIASERKGKMQLAKKIIFMSRKQEIFTIIIKEYAIAEFKYPEIATDFFITKASRHLRKAQSCPPNFIISHSIPKMTIR